MAGLKFTFSTACMALALVPVAMCQTTTAPGGEPASSDIPEELGQARDGYKEALNIGDLGEAEVLAKRVMELSIVLNGRDSIDSANALTNLAHVQYRQEQYETSKLNLLAAIITIEAIGGNLSADLIRPLHRLGETELALDEFDSAAEKFQRAIHIGHVHNGPHNTKQIESLEAIAEIHFNSGRVKAALEIQESIFALQVRVVGPESEELQPALQHQADWMHKLQLYNRERNAYFKILKIKESHHGQYDPSLIPTLIVIGTSLHEVGYGAIWPQGDVSRLDDRYIPRWGGPERYLGRAMKIAERHPQSNWEIRANTALAVGDFYTMEQDFRRARSAYKDAWQQLSIDPAGLAVRSEQLGSPKLLGNRPLAEYYEDEFPLYEPRVTDNFLRGTITAEFSVTRSGKSIKIKLLESRPPGLKNIEKRLVNGIRYVMHRPRMEDGSVTETRQLTFVYEFFYRESDGQN